LNNTIDTIIFHSFSLCSDSSTFAAEGRATMLRITEISPIQRDYDALAMAIEEGRWNDDDPRAQAIIATARARGLAPAALEVFEDHTVPTPVRERALAAIAGRVLTESNFALAG